MNAAILHRGPNDTNSLCYSFTDSCIFVFSWSTDIALNYNQNHFIRVCLQIHDNKTVGLLFGAGTLCEILLYEKRGEADSNKYIYSTYRIIFICYGEGERSE